MSCLRIAIASPFLLAGWFMVSVGQWISGLSHRDLWGLECGMECTHTDENL